MGTSPLYLAASAIYRMPHPPYLIGGIAMLWGYFKSAAKQVNRYDDREFRRFLNAYQSECLLHGKRAATRVINERQKAKWYQRNGSPSQP
jgi:hypothetical protein